MWLIAEKEKGTSYETFWDRLKEWHTKTYEGGNGNQAYADACLEIMDITQRELYPEEAKRGDAEFAKSLFEGTEPFKAPDVAPIKKRSIFEGLK